MRQLLIQVARGTGPGVLNSVKGHEGMNAACFEASGGDSGLDLVLAHLPNHRVEGFLEELQVLAPDARITLTPRGVIALKPPAEEAPQQVTNVRHRSPVEIFLGALQSVGSWRGFLGYSALAGVVVWIGLYTNTVYLLVAAMLLAPFASPAMGLAMATARGDAALIGRSLLRYFAALAVCVAVAWLLSTALQQQMATSVMVSTSLVSSVSVLLPLTAGAAGALNLSLSDRNSLVSGAATGVLVAASLAPPAGLIGMGAALGEWGMAQNGLFLILLQLAGINLTGAAVFRLFGLSARGARYERGRAWVGRVAWATTAMALAGLLAWQFHDAPSLQRSSRQQRAAAEIRRVVEESGAARLVESNVRFTRADIEGQNSLLAVVYVQKRPEAELSDSEMRHELTRRIQAALLRSGFDVTPLVDVTVLAPPSPTSGAAGDGDDKE